MKPVALTVLSGILYGLAFPPVHWWPLAWVALVPFLLAVRECGPWRGLGLGALLGIVASYGVGRWMPAAVIQYYQQSFWVGAVVFLGCALLQSSWQFAGFAFLYRRLSAREGWLTPLLIGAAWTTAELARAKPVIGNPWALLGYSQAAVPLLVQTADLAGIFGVGFLIAAVNAAIVQCWVTRAWRGLAVAAACVTAALAYGVVAERAVDAAASAGAVPVAAAQGNLDLGVQWQPEFYGANLEAYAKLTLGTAPARIVIWPENALTFFLEREPTYRAYLADLLARTNTQLLTGGPRAIADASGRVEGYRNAAFLLSRAGEVDAIYEKRVLVPFAEYFPLRGLDFMERQFGKVREFTPGTLQEPLPTLAGPVGVTICNESLIAEHTNDRVRMGAQWLVTLTNDSWVGQQQYADIALEMARVRAVEVRRWLVRSSTSGPSAIVDPAGRIVDRLAFDSRGVVRGQVVPRSDLTVYARIGDVFAWGCALAAAGALVQWRRNTT